MDRGSLVTAISKPSGDHLEQHFRICAVPSYQVDDLRTLLETPAVSFEIIFYYSQINHMNIYAASHS